MKLSKILNVAVFILLSASLFAKLPDPGFSINDKTAILITDPQIDFLSPDAKSDELVERKAYSIYLWVH